MGKYCCFKSQTGTTAVEQPPGLKVFSLGADGVCNSDTLILTEWLFGQVLQMLASEPLHSLRYPVKSQPMLELILGLTITPIKADLFDLIIESKGS
jgi:hypothetical protein